MQRRSRTGSARATACTGLRSRCPAAGKNMWLRLFLVVDRNWLFEPRFRRGRRNQHAVARAVPSDASRSRKIVHPLEVDAVELGDLGCVGGFINFLEIYLLNSVGAEGLHAGGAGHGGGGDDLDFAAFE